MIEKIDYEEIKPMFELAAKSMAGCPVPVYFRVPLQEGNKGEAFKDADGTPAIELFPIEDMEDLYKTFLHELAHVIFHVKDLEPRILPAEIAAMQKKGIQVLPASTDEEHAKYWNDPKEIEARGFADYFYEFSKRKAWVFYGEDSVKSCLRVCANTILKKENEND